MRPHWILSATFLLLLAQAKSSAATLTFDFENGDLSGWSVYITPFGRLFTSDFFGINQAVKPFDTDNDGSTSLAAVWVIKT